jgi:branched-chain amino acid transport system permease protein
MNRRTALVCGILLLIAIVLPLPPLRVYPVVAIDLVCFALFTVSLDLLFGYVGLLSFGQAMFWGGGGYVTAILLSRAHIDAVLAVVLAVLYAVVLAVAVGAIAVRRSGIYFAMVTLGIAMIEAFTASQFTDLTGGENGLPLDNRGHYFGVPIENDVAFYYIVLVLVALGVWFALRMVASPFGRVLRGMRENEQRMIALGYRVDRYKLVVFTISGALAGFAGALYALGNRLAGLDMVDWHTSGAVVMMTVLGGIGTIVGPIVGAGLFESLDYFVSKTPIGDKTNLVMGTIFALCVLTFRRGIVGELLARLAGRREVG